MSATSVVAPSGFNQITHSKRDCGMCGYCYEACALDFLEMDEVEEGHSLGWEAVRFYRPTMATNRDVILATWRTIPERREREITAINLWLRDDDDLLLEGLDSVALPCAEDEDLLHIHPAEGRESALEVINLWFECVLVPLIKRMERERPKVRSISRDEYTFALLLAVHLDRWRDPDWRYLLRRLSLDWYRLEDLARWSADEGEESFGPAPTFGDLRLWLRREALLSLWRAGFREEAAFYGEADDYRIFLCWLQAAEEPEASSMIKAFEERKFFIF